MLDRLQYCNIEKIVLPCQKWLAAMETRNINTMCYTLSSNVISALPLPQCLRPFVTKAAAVITPTSSTLSSSQSIFLNFQAPMFVLH